MRDYHLALATLGVLALKEAAHSVPGSFITLPAVHTEAGASFTQPLRLRGGILAAVLAEQEGVTDLGLGPRGELTPFNIVGVSEFGHTLKARRHVRRFIVFPIQGTGWGHLRPQTLLALQAGGSDLDNIVGDFACGDLGAVCPSEVFPFISGRWPGS